MSLLAYLSDPFRRRRPVMRIAFVWIMGGQRTLSDASLDAGVGGSGALLILYARTLAAMGHEVSVYAPIPHGGDHSRAACHGVSWHHVATAGYQTGYDAVIAVRSPQPLAGCRAPIRALLAVDQSCETLPKAIRDGTCNLLITISQHQTRRYIAQHGVPEGMILESSAGVDWGAFTIPTAKAGCIYASTPERGLVQFAHLWPRIRERVPDARLTVTSGFELYGWDRATCARHGGPLYAALRGLAGVTYAGALSRPAYQQAMMGAAVMAYPSVYDEMCCIAALEAAASGTVIVTTDRAALSERVIDGVTGYLIAGEPGTPEYDDAFVGRVAELLTQPDKRRAMGRKAREAAAAHDYDVLAAEWVQRFQGMLA
jgi:glycosyltransferase involved in cell wall biosynthesis